MSLRRRKKRGKTKEEVRNKELREREEREQLSSLHESLLTFLVRGIVVEHTSVFEASLTPHARIGQAECWHRARGGETQVALQERLWVLAEAVKSPAWSLDLGVPRSSQSLWPVTPLPKLELICGIHHAFPLSWRLGMQVSTQRRIKAQAGHKRIARCHPVIFLISPARPEFHSYFTSTLRDSLLSAPLPMKIMTCPTSRADVPLNYKPCSYLQ